MPGGYQARTLGASGHRRPRKTRPGPRKLKTERGGHKFHISLKEELRVSNCEAQSTWETSGLRVCRANAVRTEPHVYLKWLCRAAGGDIGEGIVPPPSYWHNQEHSKYPEGFLKRGRKTGAGTSRTGRGSLSGRD